MVSCPDVHPRILRYFVALAEAGTYTRAAGLMHIAVPSLSQQMRKLESDLGVTLIERDHRGAWLTPAGDEFLVSARQILTLHDQAVARARIHSDAIPDRIRIGFYGTMAGPQTRSILGAMRQLAPATQIDLVQVGWGEQITAVLDGRVDASFARPPFCDDGIRTFPVLTEERVLIASVHHPLAAKETVNVDDLSGTVHIDTDHVPDEWRRWWALDPRPDGTPVTYGPLVHSAEEMLEVIATSDAVGITAKSIADVLPRRDIAYRPIRGIEPAQIVLVLPGDSRRIGALLVQAVNEASRSQEPVPQSAAAHLPEESSLRGRA